jgi:cytochrome c oxidase assembly protein subunit 15
MADHKRAVANWLYACCALIFVMVVVGGLTRLTESGLSIVDWKPVAGALPPLSDAAWQAEFARYQTSPQFRAVNFWMTLADFKQIYWLEYIHRLLGRLIGAAFLLPLIWFAAQRRIGRKLAVRLAGIFVLGALQGALGWYMVASGLVAEPTVSHYRLAAHLALALAIGAAMLWTAFGLAAAPPEPAPAQVRRMALLVLCWLAITIVWGAFVAGLRAGAMYNTFPLMDGALVPAGAWAFEPWPLNLVENPVAVQFAHRWLAIGLVLIVVALWTMARAAPRPARRAAHLLLGLAALQAALGIATLLTAVNIALGTLHQANAALLLGAALWMAFATRRGGACADPA